MVLDNQVFKDEDKARAYLELVRWPNGPICPHCGVINHAYALNGEAHRRGLYTCADCRKQFSVTVGTLFERSHVPLHKWLMAFHLLCSSKKGHSSHQIHRMIGVTYKTAWFMTHRIREAMKDPVFTKQLGGGGKTVEIDETFWGPHKRGNRDFGGRKKEKVFSLVERDGQVRSFHVESVGAKTLKPIMREQIAKDTHIMSDDSSAYDHADKHFLSHGVIKHSHRIYVSDRGRIHTNTIEGYFSILKRGLSGVYQHVSKRHLRRYVGEFDFRYNNRKISDTERTAIALRQTAGKRLLYTRV